MFSQLSDSLDKTFRNLKGVGKISETNISEALREIRLALLEADVEQKTARDFINKVKDQALGQEVLKSVKPGEQIVKIFHDELVELLGTEQVPLKLGGASRILICGLNGAGKTTTAAKLALRLKKSGRTPLLVACDLYRPAAIDQLATLAKQADVECYTPNPGEKNLIKVAKAALKSPQALRADTLIFDTAGRQEIDKNLVEELKKLHKFLSPQETLLVADAATGQQAVSVAKHFDEAVALSGIILTKLDGDARGGAALSMRNATGHPIKFIGEGETLDDLTEFHPDRLADRILGMGDIVSMVEKVSEQISEEEAQRAAEKMAKGKFDFNDFLKQMKAIQNMGPLEGLMGMMPGFSQMKKNLPEDAFNPKRLKHIEALILSMTNKERSQPELINPSRRRRIASGAGREVGEVNQLIKQFAQMRKLFAGKGKMKAMMDAMMGGGDPTPAGGGGALPDFGGGMGGMPGMGMKRGPRHTPSKKKRRKKKR